MYGSARALCAGLVILLIASACNNPSIDPDTADKAQISLFLESSTHIQSDTAVTDTVRNTVRLGVCLYLTQYIDSTVITIGKSQADVDTVLVCKKKEREIDTVYYDVSFQSSGSRAVLATAHIGEKQRSVWAVIHVADRPIPNNAPQFLSDTVALEGSPGDPIALEMSDQCSDPDSDVITFALMPGSPAGDTIVSSLYSFLPGDADTGLFFPLIIAHDPDNASDTMTVAIRVRFVDTFPPVMHLVSPAVDGAVVGVDTVRISISCTDQSGVASVTCSRGSDTFSVSRFDTLFSAGVRNLAADELNEILFVAADSSPAANRCTLAVHIRYDPTLLDSIGPSIIQASGPDSGTVVPDSIVTITDSIIDPSGIDSVYWTRNGTRAGTMMLLSGSSALYTLRDTLTMFGPNRIVVHAVDGATRQNRDSSVIVFEFNLPPAINDTAVSTDRNAAATWTLHAQSGDNDMLAWSLVSQPANGTLSGTLPQVAFTPATNWAGVDTFRVRVTDGYWSDTARVTVTVVDVPVAPVIVTQPEDAVVRPGQSATFSVTINADVNPAPSFQWKKDGADMPGATAQSLAIGIIVSLDSGSYTVTIANSAGSVTSQAAFLAVHYPPSIETQPQSSTLYLGQGVTFYVVVTGHPVPSFVWRRNGAVIDGATGDSYTIVSPGIGDSGTYTVTVSNSAGSVTSDPARFYARVRSMACGGSHSLFLKTDGTLWACGDNSKGQLGDSSNEQSLVPKQIMTDVQSMAAGLQHTLVVKTDKTLHSFGANDNGQLGDGTRTSRNFPAQIMAQVRNVDAGDYFSLIVDADGTVYACGDNAHGQLGDDSTNDVLTPKRIMIEVQCAAAGSAHTLILANTGTVFACGLNASGQLGDSATAERHSPYPVISGARFISAGGSHSLMIKSPGITFSCGDNSSGQLGDGSTATDSIPKQVMTDILSVDAGGAHSLCVTGTGILYGFGENSVGQCGDSSATDHHAPVQIMTRVQAFAAGSSHSFILTTDGRLFGCGNNASGQVGNGTVSARQFLTEIRF